MKTKLPPLNNLILFHVFIVFSQFTLPSAGRCGAPWSHRTKEEQIDHPPSTCSGSNTTLTQTQTIKLTIATMLTTLLWPR